MYTRALYESLALVATIDPEAQGAATVESDAIDMSKYNRVLFIVAVGEMSATSTIDFTVKESDASDGTYAAIGGASPTKAITQLAGNATPENADSDKQVLVEVAAEDMGAGNRWLKGELVVGTAASDVAVVVLGAVARSQPVTHIDSVAEIVA